MICVLPVLMLFYFNSIKVRLEPALTSAAGGATGFQFHKGAIRTNKNVKWCNAFSISIP